MSEYNGSDYIYDEHIREGTMLSREFFNLFVGKRIGSGAYRIVYENDVDPDSVIKFEEPGSDGNPSFENRIEWEIWKMVQPYPSIRKWFAPCLHISPCGTVLLQAKCKPAPESKYPAKVPKCFSDFKRENWGLYKGRLVCMDYGARSTVILSEGIANCNKLKKANWWNS